MGGREHLERKISWRRVFSKKRTSEMAQRFLAGLPKRVLEDAKKLTSKDVEGFLSRERAVKAWMEAALRIKLDDDLQRALENGIVLCYLAQEVEARSVPMIHEATSSRHRLLENVYFFLAALEELGVARRFLFRVEDLTAGACMPRVVFCLEEFARVAAAARGFAVPLRPPADFPVAAAALPTGAELERLKALIVLGTPPQLKARTGPLRVSAAVIRTQLAIYAGGENKIKMDRVERGFTMVQARWRGYKARQAYKKMVRDAAYRKNVAAELLQTEKDYVENLDVCIRAFKRPMEEWVREKGAGTTAEDLASIFSDIEIIYSFNAKLLEELTPVVTDFGSRTCLAKTFMSVIGFLPLYTNYVVNYDVSILNLNAQRKKEKFEAFLKTCRANPLNVKRQDLPSYLIQPIQRVPRYLLLLNELVKHTWPAHPDYNDLHDAVVKVQKLATMLNEKKRDGENMMEMIRIDRVLTSKPKDLVLIEASRKLIKEGLFKSKSKDVSLLLFTDILIYAKGSGDKLKFEALLQITEGELVPVDKDGAAPAFEIRKLGQKKALALVTAESKDAREAFIAAFAAAVQSIRDKAKMRAELMARKPGASSQEAAAAAQPQQAPERTVEELLRDRKLKKKQEKDGSAEKLEALQSRKAVLKSQIAELTATIAAAEKKKEKETASRAKAVLSSLHAEEKELDEQIQACATALATSSSSSTGSGGSPTPSPAQSPSPAARAEHTVFGLRRLQTSPVSQSLTQSAPPTSSPSPPQSQNTVILRHVPESAKSPQARMAVRSPLTSSQASESAQHANREKPSLLRTSRVLSLGMSSAVPPDAATVSAAQAATEPHPKRSTTPPAAKTPTPSATPDSPPPPAKPRYKCATMRASSHIPQWMREDLAQTDPSAVSAATPPVRARSGSSGSSTPPKQP